MAKRLANYLKLMPGASGAVGIGTTLIVKVINIAKIQYCYHRVFNTHGKTMSNLQTVKTALTAEIKNAREGVAFYTKRIVELEKLQKQLGQLDIAEASAPSSKTGRSSMSSKRNPVTAKAAPAASDGKGKSKPGSKLPATKTAFWQGLLTDAPMANQEILAAAIAALNIRPTPVDLQKLKQRLANFITIAAKDGTIQSDGTGRARRFFAKKAE